MPIPTATEEDPFRLELYKSLRQEAASYVEKVPGIWLQKFLFAGAVVAFILQNHEGLGTYSAGGNRLVMFGFVCVPVLAMLLDVKILEYGLHARAISRFIELQFVDSPVTSAWEAALWRGGANPQIAALTRWRSVATVVVTVVPTAILVVLAAVVIGNLAEMSFVAVFVAVVIDIIYMAVGIRACVTVWPRTPPVGQ